MPMKRETILIAGVPLRLVTCTELVSARIGALSLLILGRPVALAGSVARGVVPFESGLSVEGGAEGPARRAAPRASGC